MPKHKKDTQVLIVEDNLAEAELLMYCLKQKGLNKGVVHFDQSEEALDWLFAREGFEDRKGIAYPRLIVLDINMPRISGLEMLTTIRNNPDTSTIPIVILTSSTEARDIDVAYAQGVNAYIAKPIDYNKFSTVVEQMGIFWKNINIPPRDSQ
ncbi:MAG: response regulator [Bacteroidetes bacterium]|nr:response regulator [Bacteroidota bacterium]